MTLSKAEKEAVRSDCHSTQNSVFYRKKSEEEHSGFEEKFRMKIQVAVALSLVITASAFTNTKVAHVEDTRKEYDNPDLVGYTSTADTPDFHFRRLGTTSAATEFAQVTVKFDLNKLHRHITAISTTVREAATLTPEEQSQEIHMYQQLDSELRSLRERVEYIFHLVETNQEQAIHRPKRFIFTVAFAILASAIAVGASVYTAVEVNKLSETVENIKTAGLSAIDKNIKTLIASRDLASIVEATVSIANQEVQAEVK